MTSLFCLWLFTYFVARVFISHEQNKEEAVIRGMVRDAFKRLSVPTMWKVERPYYPYGYILRVHAENQEQAINYLIRRSTFQELYADEL